MKYGNYFLNYFNPSQGTQQTIKNFLTEFLCFVFQERGYNKDLRVAIKTPYFNSPSFKYSQHKTIF